MWNSHLPGRLLGKKSWGQLYHKNQSILHSALDSCCSACPLLRFLLCWPKFLEPSESECWNVIYVRPSAYGTDQGCISLVRAIHAACPSLAAKTIVAHCPRVSVWITLCVWVCIHSLHCECVNVHSLQFISVWVCACVNSLPCMHKHVYARIEAFLAASILFEWLLWYKCHELMSVASPVVWFSNMKLMYENEP